MSDRQLDDWIEGYMEYVKESESPKSFHYWSAVSTIAGALQRRVFFERGSEKIYPNNYIILVGSSGESRKADPINTCKDLLSEIPVNMTSESSTMEALILDVDQTETSFLHNDVFIWQAPICCFIEELSVLARGQNTELLAILTNWYDSRAKWTYKTKHQGDNEIHGVCFNMLAGCAPDWFPHIFTKEAIGGGFSSRCIFVVESFKHQTVALPNKRNKSLRSKLLYDLETMLTIGGEFSFSGKAAKRYKEWYEEQDRQVKDGNWPVADPMFRGYTARRQTHLIKTAMCLNVSRGCTMKIEEQDFDRALDLMLKTEKSMPNIFSSLNQGKYAEATEQIMRFIEARGSAWRSEIQNRYWRMVDDFTLDNILKALLNMKLVSQNVDPKKNDIEYRWRKR